MGEPIGKAGGGKPSSTKGEVAKNPKLLTLLAILKRIYEHEPTNFYQLSKMRDSGYLTIYRYFNFCVQQGLVSPTGQGKSQRATKYVLSKRGRALLRLFGEVMP